MWTCIYSRTTTSERTYGKFTVSETCSHINHLLHVDLMSIKDMVFTADCKVQKTWNILQLLVEFTYEMLKLSNVNVAPKCFRKLMLLITAMSQTASVCQSNLHFFPALILAFLSLVALSPFLFDHAILSSPDNLCVYNSWACQSHQKET